MLMARILRIALLALTAASCVACSGPGGGAHGLASGGKSSTAPLAINLQATPSPASLNAAVTFSVTCESVVSSNNALTYHWDFGDGAVETTFIGSVTHAYTSPSPAGSGYDYTVSCQDGSQSTPLSNSLIVQNFDFNTVASGTCSAGKRGHGWCWQQPLPTGANLQTVTALTPLSAWVAGDGGAVLLTDDGGQTWVPKFPTTSANFIGIYSNNHNEVTLTTSDAEVFSTRDAGETWSCVPQNQGKCAPPGLTLSHASMTDAQHVWAITGGNIVQTADGGQSWNNINISGGVPAGTRFSAISAATAAGPANVWAVGNQIGTGASIGIGVTAHTSDGSTWTSGTSPLTANMTLNTVSVTAGPSRCTPTSPSTGSVWLAGTDVALRDGTHDAASVESAESLDGGTTWNTSVTGGGSVIAAFDSSTAFQTLPQVARIENNDPVNEAFGRTTGGNQSWSFPSPSYPFYGAPPVVFEPINAFDSKDCQSGWAVGNTGAIAATNDSGNNWTGQAAASATSPAGYLAAIAAINPLHAYALAIDSRTRPETTHIADDNFVYVTIIATTDGGRNWSIEYGTGATSLSQKISTMERPTQAQIDQLASDYLTQLRHAQVAANSQGDAVAAGPGFVTNKPYKPGASWGDAHSAQTLDETAVSAPLPIAQWPTSTIGRHTDVIVQEGVAPSQAFEVWKAVAITAGTAWVIDGLGDVVTQQFDSTGGIGGGICDMVTVVTACWKLVSAAATLPLAAVSYPQNLGTQPAPAGGNGIAAVDLSPGGVVAVIVGAGGLISRSTDGGLTWATIPPLSSADLNSVSIVPEGPSAGNGWAVGPGGTLLRTTDAGAHWTVQHWTTTAYSAADLNFASVSTFDGNSAMVLVQVPGSVCSKDCNFVLRTDDGGASWSPQTIGADRINYVTMLDTSNAWLVGLPGKILKTVTGGFDPPY